MRPIYQLYRFAWTGLDWLYPPACGGCGGAGARWCDHCQQNTLQIRLPICDCCGQMQQFPGLCSKCPESPPPYQAQRSWAIYQGPVRNAIHRLKYNGVMALGEILARGLIQLLNLSSWNLEMIVPVPVGIARQKQRGYNQAALLARTVAYRPIALIKTRDTRSQVGLTYEERFANVRSVFQAGGEIVSGKNILVIDDVSTSGATMAACAQALMDTGAAKVYGLTLARTVHPVGQGVR